MDTDVCWALEFVRLALAEVPATGEAGSGMSISGAELV